MLGNNQHSVIWGIGSSALKNYERTFSGLIYCEEPLDPELSDTLNVTVCQQKQQRKLSLSLPNKAIQTRLLRHPLKKEEVQIAPTQKAKKQVDPAGKYLIVRHPVVRVTVIKAPDEYRYGACYQRHKTRKFDQGLHPILGCDTNGKHLLIMQLREDGILNFNFLGKWLFQTKHFILTDQQKDLSDQSQPVFDKNTWHYCTWWREDAIVVLDVCNTLWLYDTQDNASPKKIATDVLCFIKSNETHSIYLLQQNQKSLMWMCWKGHGLSLSANFKLDNLLTSLNIENFSGLHPHFGGRNIFIDILHSTREPTLINIAYEYKPYQWVKILAKNAPWVNEKLDNTTQVVGIINDDESPTELLCWQGHLLFSLFQNKKTERRYFDTPPIAMAYHTKTDCLAWVDQDKNLHFMRLKKRLELLPTPFTLT